MVPMAIIGGIIVLSYNAAMDRVNTAQFIGDLITIAIPPALPACMVVGVALGMDRLKRKQINCIAPSRINMAGKVERCCFDKTGTLTIDGLRLQLIDRTIPTKPFAKFDVSIVGREWRKSAQNDLRKELDASLSAPSPDNEGVRNITFVMAACHALRELKENIVDGKQDVKEQEAKKPKLIGDPLEVELFEACGWTMNATGEFMEMISPAGNIKISQIATNEFASEFMCMSVVVTIRTADGKQQHMIVVKGAPDKVSKVSIPSTVPDELQPKLDEYELHGYRLIGIGVRTLSDEELKAIREGRVHRNEQEKDLEFCGLFVLENPLKSDTPSVIKKLHDADIPVVMITGDAPQTAVSIARYAGILEDKAPVLVVDCAKATLKIAYELIYWNSTETDANGKPGKWIKISPIPENEAHQLILQKNSEFYPKTRWSLPIPIEALGGLKVVLTGVGLNAVDHELLGDTAGDVRCKELSECIIRRVAVAARCKPLHKKKLVLLFMQLGEYTSFCGDGANDSIALKTADIGVSLTSNAEAAVAAPFTSVWEVDGEKTIDSVVTVLLEGRAALATNFALFRFMALYSYIQFTNSVQGLLYETYPGEFQFMYVDLLLVLPLCFIAPRTEAYDKLTDRRLPGSLMKAEIVLSLLGHAIICLGFQIAGRALTWEQCWCQPIFFHHCPEPEETVTIVTDAINAINATLLGIPEGSFDTAAVSAAVSGMEYFSADNMIAAFFAVNETLVNATSSVQSVVFGSIYEGFKQSMLVAFPAVLDNSSGCVELGCLVKELPPANCPGFLTVGPTTCVDPLETATPRSYQTSALWHVCAFQYLFMILAFSTGPPFRKYVFTNLGFVGIFITLFILNCLILLLVGGWLETFFEFMPYPEDNNFKWRLFGICLGSGATSFLWESVLLYVNGYLAKKKQEKHKQEVEAKGLSKDLARQSSGRR